MPDTGGMRCSRSENESVWTVRQMQGAPAEEAGIGQGVSACYAGVHNGMLMMAGGCNFPEVPASEGGKKRFYRGIYVADASADSVFVWKKPENCLLRLHTVCLSLLPKG